MAMKTGICSFHPSSRGRIHPLNCLDLAAGTGTSVWIKTVSRRLHERGLYARKPDICIPLTPSHKRVHADNIRIKYSLNGLMFSSPRSADSVYSDSGRLLVWRVPGTRSNPSNIIERDHYDGGGLMFRAGIIFDGGTPLHVFGNGFPECPEMYDLLKGLTEKYRRISRLEVIGSTVERRSIYAVHISKSQSRRNPVILIECGIHAREWASFEVCFYFISELLKQKTQQVKTVTSKYDFVIIPALNPDGYVYTWTKNRMWRKNRSCNLSRRQCVDECVGVDINRNFDVNFCEKGTSSHPCKEDYCGKFAFSEPESRAMKKMITRLRNRMLAYFAFHSFMSVWTYPWVKSQQTHPNFEELDRVARVATSAIERIDNTIYTVGNAAKLIYVVSGSTIDYAAEVGNAKYSYAIELRQGKTQKTGFIMREEEIIPLCRETFQGLIKAILSMQPDRN